MRFKRLRRAAFFIFILAIAAFAAGGDSSAQGDKTLFPAFGAGPVEVRLYSDYFCFACQQLEPLLEPVLNDLLKRKAIRLVIVDYPMHAESPLYARYFLYALKSRNDAEYALHVRNILYTAGAGKDFLTAQKVEELFRSRKVSYAVCDPKPVFERYNALIKEDQVNRTPLVVIVKAGKKETLVGGPDILKALKDLK